MTIEEAIKHCEDVALSCKDNNSSCALEHIQLAEWLKELKYYRNKIMKKRYIREGGISQFWDQHVGKNGTIDYQKLMDEIKGLSNQ